jgi:hypothetical protein
MIAYRGDSLYVPLWTMMTNFKNVTVMRTFLQRFIITRHFPREHRTLAHSPPYGHSKCEGPLAVMPELWKEICTGKTAAIQRKEGVISF